MDHYRAAIDGFDPHTYPDDWADAQLKLANALRVLAFWDKGTKTLEDAMAANRAALTVYSKQDAPLRWAAAQGQLAECLNQLGQETSNPDDFRKSISILRQVLNGYPRAHAPSEWSALQSAFGDVLDWDFTISIKNQETSIRSRPRLHIAPASRN